MPGARWKTTVRQDGPFFRGDPAKTFRHNLHDMMEDIAARGRDDVIGAMVATESERAPIRALGDRVADHVVGELRKRPAGPPYTAVVFVRNSGFTQREARSLMAAASQVEGSIHAFRRTFGRIKGVIKADPFKGLN